jgi:hypothetical protein
MRLEGRSSRIDCGHSSEKQEREAYHAATAERGAKCTVDYFSARLVPRHL